MKRKIGLHFPLITFFRGGRLPMRVRAYWRHFMESTQKRMSRGSSNISKIITFARRENWRRKEEKK